MSAVLVDPDQLTRAELQRAVQAVYYGAPILLADGALTTDSSLVLQHPRRLDAGGLRLNGRELDRPEIFDLVIAREGCVLIHRRSGQRVVLRTAHCVRPR